MAIWKKVKVGDFLFEREGRYKPDSLEISGLQRIDKIDFSGNFHIANKPSKTDMILIKPGDLVISGINVAKGALGVYHGQEDVTATIHYSSYTFDESKVSVEYFKRFLKSPLFVQLLKEQVKGGIKTEIKPKHLLPLEILLPDKQEQLAILSQFQRIENEDDELKSEITHQQTLLKKLRQQILQEAIEGKLTADWRAQNPDVEPASELLKRIAAEKAELIQTKKIKKGKKQPASPDYLGSIDVPAEWELPDLDDISQYITDGTHQTPRYTDSGEIFLSAQNVKPFRFMPEDHKFVSREDFQSYIKNKTPEVGDLLVGRVGSKGETAVIDVELEFAFYVSLGFVKTFKQHTCPSYLAIVMNSPYGRGYATGNMSSTGASAGNFNLGRIRSFPIPFPSLSEQNAIVSKVERLFCLCDQLGTQIIQNQSHAEQLMQAVLKEAFSHNSAAEPAAPAPRATAHA